MDKYSVEEMRIGIGLIPHAGCDVTDEDFAVLETMMANKEASAQEITDYFHKIHSTDDSKTDDCKNLKDSFLCLAAVYDRVDVFENNQPLQTDCSTSFNPLIVAVHCRHMNMIQMLVSAGYRPDIIQDCFKFAEPIGPEPCSAALNTLDEDDGEVMKILLQGFPQEKINKISKQAAFWYAEKCFLATLKEIQERKLDIEEPEELCRLAVSRLDVNVLQEMKSMGFDFTCRILNNGTTLHAAAEHALNAFEDSHLEVIKFLLAEGVKAYDFNRLGSLPIDDIIRKLVEFMKPDTDQATHEEFCQQVLDGVYMLIQAMRREKPGKVLLVPRYTVSLLQQSFYLALLDILRNHLKGTPIDPNVAKLSLDLCTQILEMVLAAGVDFTKDECSLINNVAQHFYSTYRDPEVYGYTTNDHLDLICDVLVRWLLEDERYVNPGRDHLKQYEEYIVRFNMLQLAYGLKPDGGCFEFLSFLLKLNLPNLTTGVIQPILSLMPAHDIKLFKQHMEDMEDKDQSQKLDLSLLSDTFCRPKLLKEANRYAMYETIKDRRMVVHVNLLPLPKPLKKYLCMDYEISEEKARKFKSLSAIEDGNVEELNENKEAQETQENKGTR